MSSIFVSFCFIKTISGGNKYVSGTGLYRISNDVDALEKLRLKALLVALIQTIPISFSDNEYVLTSDNLPYSSPLLLFSAPVVQGSYCPDNEGGRESFVLTRRLYNGVTNNKYVPSNIILSLHSTSAKNPNNNTVYVNFANIVSQVRLVEHSPNNSNPIPQTTKQINLSNANISGNRCGTSALSNANISGISDTRTDAGTSALPNADISSISFSDTRTDAGTSTLSDANISSISSLDTRTDAGISANSSEPVINASADLPLSQDKVTKCAKKGLRPLLPLKK
ncbi:hypothetical protein F8M41_011471 [Gigaspora margarita]|uniref:Uncharacterized protein n=1 Tax=Gigaspora margarita TaxID=4874 RepID=A0A8H3WZ45_GIGMA|nr:hypothetical protein F8M41_011471 [Gigaspora margarita]